MSVNTAFDPDKKRRVMITGAGRRLGFEIARGLIDKGLDVVLHSRSVNPGIDRLLSLAREKNTATFPVYCDFSDPGSIEPMFHRMLGSFGPIDVLINNASIFKAETPVQMTLESLQRHLDINLTAPVLLSKLFFESLDGRPGDIIHILDWRWERPEPKHFSYSISKTALASAVRMTARWFAPHVRVNAIAPGAILPPEEEPYDENVILRYVPMNRWGNSREVFETIWFLIDGPRYITGEILTLDGGRHLF